jgi:scyllo-inositol 2-dehydrogenase (NADP+)
MIRVGLVGFGTAGRVFHAPLISSVEGLELAAVVERNSGGAALRYPGIVTYRSLEAMLEDGSLGLLVVATPTESHFPIVQQILQAGKNVVVDKPMAVASIEIAQLIKLAGERNVLLSPFHSRRWDDNLRTLRKLMQENSLGRLVHAELNWDRWRPVPRAGSWREKLGPGAGVLLDLGTHLIDQTLELFGLPQSVSAEVGRERDGEGPDDSFTLRLGYPRFTAIVSSNCLSSLQRPNVHLRGTKGNFWKWGLDPQEEALKTVAKIGDEPWAREPVSSWGTLATDVDGSMVTSRVEPVYGDYRLYYAGIRDALLTLTPPPVSALAAWRVARQIEWVRASSEQRREIPCDWREEPESASPN